jgi:hypothetical protein
MATPEEQNRGIAAMNLDELPKDFAHSMLNSIITQLRTYSVGMRVDDWIWDNIRELRSQQEHSIRSQLSENLQALAPEILKKFPKPLVDANSVMNAAFATKWGKIIGEPQFCIPFKAMGYAGKAKELLEIIEVVAEEPLADRDLIERWSKCLGLDGCFHFESHSFA